MKLKEGVVKLVLVARRVPPTLALYHLTVFPFDPGIPLNIIEPLPQCDAPFPMGEDGTGFTEAVTATRAAVLSHPVLVLYELA